MKNRVASALLVTTIACATFLTLTFVTDVKEPNNSLDAAEDVEVMPLDVSIDSGDNNNKTGLNTSYKLNNDNGKYVNLHVENKGSNDVVATINGNSSRVLKPGDKGTIYAEVVQGFFDEDKEYVFKVVPGKNGGIVNIYYEIIQQDTKLHTDNDSAGVI